MHEDYPACISYAQLKQALAHAERLCLMLVGAGQRCASRRLTELEASVAIDATRALMLQHFNADQYKRSKFSR